MAKSYTERCGYCKHMDLYSGYKFCGPTTFKCTRNNYSVKADEKACSRFEPDRNRSNDIIAKYDK